MLLLEMHRIKGAMILGIMMSTLIALWTGLVPWPKEFVTFHLT